MTRLFVHHIKLIFILGIIMQTYNGMAVSSYLALGDSYTIGEGVAVSDSWPYLLVKKLNAKGISIDQPKVIARTGWRTDNLLDAIESENLVEKFDLVSLLIGVNNQFQGKSLETYKKDMRSLLNKAIELSKHGKSKVFVLSIPDYGATPFGKLERESIGKEIDQWNLVCKEICDEFQIAFFDITAISKKAIADPALTAKDKLHPSAKMYSLWVDEIIEKVREILKK